MLTGSLLPSLLGSPPERIVAFRYDGGWIQVPVQVDERAWVDFGVLYGGFPAGVGTVTYTDPLTYAGPDPDATFDADDELVLRIGDAGSPAVGVAEPPGTVPGSGLELEIRGPLSGAVAYLYLFRSDGSLDPAAGRQLVQYEFVLLSGDYLSTYNLGEGFNPEDSRVQTWAYRVHFSDRWIRDATAVLRDGATGVDLLDRHKFALFPGNCGRTEDTFSYGPGAFIANRVGPLRAIRGYIGANSGTYTTRVHLFYESREQIITDLRVHTIPGLLDYFDYAPAAAGMTYANDLNPAGVVVDGVPDVVVPGQVVWEMVSGAQGTLVHVHRFETNVPNPSYTHFYSDTLDPDHFICSGDPWEYAASGPWRTQEVPNTDPTEPPPVFQFRAIRTLQYAPPGADASFAQDVARRVQVPVQVQVDPFDPATCPDHDGDGFALCQGSCNPALGASCGDCDDTNGLVHPGQSEACASGVDDNCDGLLDCQDTVACPPGPDPPPGPIAGVVFGADKRTVVWQPDPGAQVYDLLGGDLAELRAAGDFSGAECLAWRLSAPLYADARDPLPGQGLYLLVRGKRDPCILGTWGSPLRDAASAVCP